MGSAYWRGKKIWIKYRDESGETKRKPTQASSLAKGREIANDLECEGRKRALGLTDEPVGMDLTFARLSSWWLREVSAHKRSHKTDLSHDRVHFQTWVGYERRLRDLRAHDFHRFLEGKKNTQLSLQMVKHLRTHLVRLFNDARRHGFYTGPNPTAELQTIKLPAPRPRALTAEESQTLIDGLTDNWRPLFATALYTGMRKGELLALRCQDVDMQRGEIRVRRNNDRNSTKTGGERIIPIVEELKPSLMAALSRTTSQLVFPNPDGSQRRHDAKLSSVLRRAFARMGVVERWDHKCRRPGCVWVEHHQDDDLRLCPRCNMKLWPKAVHVRHMFKDLRSTCVTLNLEAGVPLLAVSALVGHDDPRTTLRFYQQSNPAWVGRQLSRVHLFDHPATSAAQTGVLGGFEPQGTNRAQPPLGGGTDAGNRGGNTPEINEENWRAARDSNPRPLASEASALSN